MIMVEPICEICNSKKRQDQFSLICTSCEHSSLMQMAKGCLIEIAIICSNDDHHEILNGLSKLCERLDLGDFFQKEVKPKFLKLRYSL